jgi:RimJ/RimL family protein N-acetyltransferase
VSTYWPLVDLRLRTADLVLRPMVEADLDRLADLVTASTDIELDPSLPAFEGIAGSDARGVAVHQFYWRALGSWRPGSWRLLTVAEHGGELVGSQDLKGGEYGALRTVETASYLFLPWRGRGFGGQMRRAVLALAFDHHEALAADTEAWHDNAASLGVSRSVGYQPNGETLHDRDGRLDRMVRMRMTREQWVATGAGASVQVDGFDACRHLFG